VCCRVFKCYKHLHKCHVQKRVNFALKWSSRPADLPRHWLMCKTIYIVSLIINMRLPEYNPSSDSSGGFAHNNMATIGFCECPYEFESEREQDPIAFLRSFREYAIAIGWSDLQRVVAFKLALKGDAGVWIQKRGSGESLEELEAAFIKRFRPANFRVRCITELAEAAKQPGESLRALLDRMKVIALRGELPETVLLAMVLKALPVGMANALAITYESLTWETLCQVCSIWMVTQEKREIASSCFAISRERLEEHAGINKYCCSKRWAGRRHRMERQSKKCYTREESRAETTPFRGKCVFCGTFGHKAIRCEELKRLRKNQQGECMVVQQASMMKESICLCSDKSGAERPMIPVSIQGRRLHALCDTGSSLSLLDSSVVLGLKLEKAKSKITTANGCDVEVIGKVTIPVSIGQTSSMVEFVVCKGLVQECVFGSDFMKLHGTRIKFRAKKKGDVRVHVDGVENSQERREIVAKKEVMDFNGNKDTQKINEHYNEKFSYDEANLNNRDLGYIGRDAGRARYEKPIRNVSLKSTSSIPKIVMGSCELLSERLRSKIESVRGDEMEDIGEREPYEYKNKIRKNIKNIPEWDNIAVKVF